MSGTFGNKGTEDDPKVEPYDSQSALNSSFGSRKKNSHKKVINSDS